MSAIGFGKNDKSFGSSDMEYYRGEKNRTDMVSFCWFFEDDNGGPLLGENDTPKFIAEDVYYLEGMGYVTANDYLRDKMGQPPRSRIGTFVVHYRTAKDGSIMKPFEYEIKPWIFSENKFAQLRTIHSEYPLTRHDLRITCEDDQYQKMSFIPSRNESLWQQKPELKAEILEQVKRMSNRLSVGREVPLDQLKERFGDTLTPVPSAASETDFDDFLDSFD